MNFSSQKIQSLVAQGKLTQNIAAIMQNFFISFREAVKENQLDPASVEPTLNMYLELVAEQIKNPYQFEPFHIRITSPFNYYSFGLDLIRPLIVFSKSKVHGKNNILKMKGQLGKGENVILLANHQTEPDPQAISLLLEKEHPQFAEEMIFVAGHRVISDPLAIPISMGCNLCCIFSKKHIENPPEKKQEKLLHNQRTMKKLSQLLSEGGKCIYVAPSGGRDRPNPDGEIDVAPFDPNSVEMFWLMAQQSGKPTHFYPLALATYKLLPPPNSVEKKLGERRQAHCTPVHLAFGDELDMANIPGDSVADKKTKRKQRADHIWNLVRSDYQKLLGSHV